MSVWSEIDRLKEKYLAEIKSAREAGKVLGFVGVKCSEAGLLWSAQRSDAEKFEEIKGRPAQLGPFKTSAELVEAMQKFAPARDMSGGTKIPAEAHAAAAAFLDGKR